MGNSCCVWAVGCLAILLFVIPLAAAPDIQKITEATGIDRGLALVIDNNIDSAAQLAESGRWLVHLLASDSANANRLRASVQKQNLGGRVVVGVLPTTGFLPHPDRFVNLVLADIDLLGKRAPTMSEIQRILAVRGSASLRQGGQWKTIPKQRDPRLDGWFSHWYDAAGNCVSNDKLAGFPIAVQWQHGPALEDGTADGKIPRIADGRTLFMDNLSGDLICRDAGNGLLLWRLHIGSVQNSDISIAAGRIHVWLDPKRTDRDRDREVGTLAAVDLSTGKVVQVYDQGLKAGTAKSIEYTWEGRKQRQEPVPWFVVNDKVIVQSYGPDLVVLDRKTGKRLWTKKLADATWFSPIVSDDQVLAAEAVIPGRRRRNNGTDHVRAVIGFSLKDGKQLWRNDQIHPIRSFIDKKTSKPFESRSSFKTMSVAQGMVLIHLSSYQFRTGGAIVLLDQKTGKQLWRREFKPKELYTQGSQRPVIRGDQVVVLDGTGAYRFDARSGEPVGDPIKRPRNLRRTGRTNGACTASRATVNWLMANAWLYVGPDGKSQIHHGARGACGQGVVPAHGLVYLSPTPCDCGDYMRGYLALSPTRPGKPVADADRLTTGVVAPKVPKLKDFKAPWPVFLGNNQRTSSSEVQLGTPLKPLWNTQITKLRQDEMNQDRRNSERYLGALSAPVAADGLIVVAAPEAHQVIAIESTTGKQRWTFQAGGKVDSPPTLAQGMAVFGCDDGAIYALRLNDGKLIWRFMAAPTNGLALQHGHISSAYAVPGSVLIIGDTVAAVAGNHTDLGGLHVWTLSLKTGKPRAKRVLGTDLPPALGNNLIVGDETGNGFWVVSPKGGSYGAGGAYHLDLDLKDLLIEKSGPGPVMSFDRQGSRVRFRTDRGRGGSTHGWKGAMRGNLFHRLQGHRVAMSDQMGFAMQDPSSRTRTVLTGKQSREKDADPLWELDRKALDNVDSLGAMIVAGKQLIVAGGKRNGSSGSVFILDTRTGAIQQKLDLKTRVSECGLAVGPGALYVTCEDGTVYRFGK